MSSNRLALAVIIAVGVALVPTLLHSYAAVTADDAYHTAAIAPRLAGLTSQPTARRAEWVNATFASDDWIERRYLRTDGEGLLLFVARSFDLKRLYHHPELAVAYGNDLRDEGTARLPGRPQIPIHVLRDDAAQGSGLAVYALLYDGEFVDNPYLFQLETAWRLLFTVRRAMTLFFVHDPGARPAASLAEAPAMRLLVGAIDSFQSQTRPTSRK